MQKPPPERNPTQSANKAGPKNGYSFSMPITQVLWGNLASPDLMGGLNKCASAMMKMAEAIQANAEATILLARATAGEFEDSGEVEQGERYLDGRPK